MKTNFINPFLQVGSGSNEKSNGSGSGGQKSTDPTGSGSSSLHFVHLLYHCVLDFQLEYTVCFNSIVSLCLVNGYRKMDKTSWMLSMLSVMASNAL